MLFFSSPTSRGYAVAGGHKKVVGEYSQTNIDMAKWTCENLQAPMTHFFCNQPTASVYLPSSTRLFASCSKKTNEPCKNLVNKEHFFGNNTLPVPPSLADGKCENLQNIALSLAGNVVSFPSASEQCGSDNHLNLDQLIPKKRNLKKVHCCLAKAATWTCHTAMMWCGTMH